MSNSDPRPPTSDSDVLVRVEGVSKKFCRSLKRSLWYGVCDMASELNPFGEKKAEGGDQRSEAREQKLENGPQTSDLRPQLATGLCPQTSDSSLRKGEFWAVKDVSFELRRGECLGLIGRNGAGKTTLLKMLNGLIKPDHGQITMRGRVGALIALGAGFNPILTGRENIYVNGSILGLAKHEIDSKIDEIIDFSDIREFIDSPVQSFSSGMQVRLGFAVATALKPDILLIDEVLAVGDTSFKVRCYNRIRDLLPRTAVIFVSHSMFDIARVCSRILVMKSGKLCFDGSKEDGINAYEEINHEGSNQQISDLVVHRGQFVSEVKLINFEMGAAGLESSVDIRLNVRCEADLGRVRIRVVFHDDSAGPAPVAEWDSEVFAEVHELKTGENQLSVKVSKIRLRSGRYRVIFMVTDPHSRGYHVNIEYGLLLIVRNAVMTGAYYRI